jgi:hypothetical protein
MRRRAFGKNASVTSNDAPARAARQEAARLILIAALTPKPPPGRIAKDANSSRFENIVENIRQQGHREIAW